MSRPIGQKNKFFSACAKKLFPVPSASFFILEEVLNTRPPDVEINKKLLTLVKAGQANQVLAVLQAGADANTRDFNGYAALHLATMSQFPQVVKVLLSNKANADAKTILSDTALHLAVTGRCLDVIAELIKGGADQEVKNRFEMTPRDLAVSLDCSEVVNFLDHLHEPRQKPNAKVFASKGAGFGRT